MGLSSFLTNLLSNLLSLCVLRYLLFNTITFFLCFVPKGSKGWGLGWGYENTICFLYSITYLISPVDLSSIDSITIHLDFFFYIVRWAFEGFYYQIEWRFIRVDLLFLFVTFYPAVYLSYFFIYNMTFFYATYVGHLGRARGFKKSKHLFDRHKRWYRYNNYGQ